MDSKLHIVWFVSQVMFLLSLLAKTFLQKRDRVVPKGLSIVGVLFGIAALLSVLLILGKN